jgi:hypothetical protein
MKWKLAVLAIGLGVFGQGCNLVCHGVYVVTFKTAQYVSDCREKNRNRKWAEAAWKDVQKADPGAPYSEDYGKGFKEGFTTFVYRGGTGEPPPVAPPRYRTLKYQTPEGYQAIQDWFAGYRHGVDVAQKGGYRQWVTGPTSLRCQGPVSPHPPVEANPPVPAPPPHEFLPDPPKVMPDAESKKTDVPPKPSAERTIVPPVRPVEIPLPTEKGPPNPGPAPPKSLADSGKAKAEEATKARKTDAPAQPSPRPVIVPPTAFKQPQPARETGSPYNGQTVGKGLPDAGKGKPDEGTRKTSDPPGGSPYRMIVPPGSFGNPRPPMAPGSPYPVPTVRNVLPDAGKMNPMGEAKKASPQPAAPPPPRIVPPPPPAEPARDPVPPPKISVWVEPSSGSPPGGPAAPVIRLAEPPAPGRYLAPNN